MKTRPRITMSFTVSADKDERRRIVRDLDAQVWPYKIVRTKARPHYHPNEEWSPVYANDDTKSGKWHSPHPDNYEARFKVVKDIVTVILTPHDGKFHVDIRSPYRHFGGNQTSPFLTEVETPESILDTIIKVLCAVEAKTMKDMEENQVTQDRKMKIMRERFGDGFVVEETHNGYNVRLDGVKEYGLDLNVSVYLDEEGGDIVQVNRIDSFNIGSPQLLERVKELMRMIALQAKMEEVI